MTFPIFRHCHQEDLQAVATLVTELYSDDPGEFPAQPDIRATFDELARRPEKGQIIVFELEGDLVGYAILVFFWSNEFGGDIIEIDEMVVSSKHRSRGIGKAFFTWLDSTYTGCAGYALQTTEHNEMARKLYQAAGFKQSKNTYFIKTKS